MSMDAAILRELWQGGLVEAVPASQRWVLTAMQHHGPGLVNMLWRVLGDEHDVCDIYQDTFLHLANYFENRPRPRNARAYLYRTAMNTAVSLLRRRKLQKQYQQTVRQQQTAEEFHVDYGRQLDTRALRQQLRDAIAKLPEYLADVILLRDLAELPYEEVSSILGITRAAARVYRHKAITMLAAIMAKEE